ncbi:MAG: GAF domain-containing protein [Pseudomonadota bacterium]
MFGSAAQRTNVTPLHPVQSSVPTAPGRVEILAALDRVLAADGMAQSPRLTAFLSFIVNRTLDGDPASIKGYTIGVDALGRSPDFDPQSDPTVRVFARRLRDALAAYYAGPGADDPIRIDIPKGGYVPTFSRNEPAPFHLSDTESDFDLHSLQNSAPRCVSDLAPKLQSHQRAILDQVAATAVNLTGAATAIVTLEDGKSIDVIGHHGLPLGGFDASYSLSPCLDPTAPMIVIDDVASDPRLDGHPLRALRPAFTRLIIIPVKRARGAVAALIIGDPGADYRLSARHASFLCDLAAIAGTALAFGTLAERDTGPCSMH